MNNDIHCSSCGNSRVFTNCLREEYGYPWLLKIGEIITSIYYCPFCGEKLSGNLRGEKVPCRHGWENSENCRFCFPNEIVEKL